MISTAGTTLIKLGQYSTATKLDVRIYDTYDYARRIVAKAITVDGDDLATTEMIQAGLHGTTEQVAANMRAIEA